MACSSSLTLPGQSYAWRDRMACSDMPVTFLFLFSLQFFRKYSARIGMSSVLSLSGGRCTGTTLIR